MTKINRNVGGPSDTLHIPKSASKGLSSLKAKTSAIACRTISKSGEAFFPSRIPTIRFNAEIGFKSSTTKAVVAVKNTILGKASKGDFREMLNVSEAIESLAAEVFDQELPVPSRLSTRSVTKHPHSNETKKVAALYKKIHSIHKAVVS